MEILVAIMIMAIGIVSVMTLFPISVLRTVQATKLTNSTILRFNAEAFIDIDPRLVTDPDLDITTIQIGEKYLVDPLGANITGADDAAYISEFGDPAFLPRLPRYQFGLNLQQAEGLVGHADSWNSQVDGIATNPLPLVNSTSIDLVGVDLSSVNFTAPFVSRVLLVDETGRNSLKRIITSVNNSTKRVSWANALPASFTVASARIETRQLRDYTWMLTVRNNNLADIQVDVVVFFRRGFGTQDEQIFEATREDSAVYLIDYPPGTEKNWRKGGYMFDIDAARWYRIQRVEEVGNGVDRISLETPPVVQITRAAFMKNVVEVYPIGNKGN